MQLKMELNLIQSTVSVFGLSKTNSKGKKP